MSRSRTPKRFFCAEMTSRIADLEMPCVFIASSSMPGGKLRLLVSAHEMPAITRGLPFHEPAHEQREGLRVHERRQHLDEGDGRVLVRFGQGAEHGFDRRRAQILELGDGFLRGRVRGVGGRPDLRDQAIRAQVGEKAHSAFTEGLRRPREIRPRQPVRGLAGDAHACGKT